jgi:hypothetical protein
MPILHRTPGIDSGSGKPKQEKVGKVTKAQVEVRGSSADASHGPGQGHETVHAPPAACHPQWLSQRHGCGGGPGGADR